MKDIQENNLRRNRPIFLTFNTKLKAIDHSIKIKSNEEN